MTERPNAPSAVRNRGAILRVLQHELDVEQRVLEIGSGTGQHAVHFAAAMPHLIWQTSDRQSRLQGIRSWRETSGLENLPAPLSLDVSDAGAIDQCFDVVFSANTAHILSQDSVADMLSLSGKVLSAAGKFILYGPFKVDGRFTSDSNERFDRSLRSQDPAMGIRDLEWIDGLGTANRLKRLRSYAMPANNLLLVWQKSKRELIE